MIVETQKKRAGQLETSKAWMETVSWVALMK